jgi:hypothetical protein
MSDRQVATSDQLAQAVVKKAAEALQAFKAFKGLRFGSELDFQTAPVFHTEVTELAVLPKDAYHTLEGGSVMPKKPLTNAIGDAVGVVYTENCGTRKGPGKYEVIGWAQGRKRMPDGTWKTSKVCEYSFDPEVRSEIDFNTDERKDAKDRKYAREIDQKKHVLDLRKFSTQRASTGAALMVIRDLANVPTAFKAHEINQPMLFTRIALNTDELLQDPRARAEIVRMAIGAQTEIYGPRDVTEPRPALAAPAEPTPEADDFDEPPAEQPPFAVPAAPPAPPDPRAAVRAQLAAALADSGKRDYLSKWVGKSGAVALDTVSALLADETATLEALTLWAGRCAKIGGAA